MTSMKCITTWNFNEQEPFLLARRFSDIEGTVFFYSGGSYDSAKSSYLCLFPVEKITLQTSKGCWDILKKQLGELDSDSLPIPCWVGYVGYEMGSYADHDKHIPCLYPHVDAMTIDQEGKFSSQPPFHSSSCLSRCTVTPDCCFYAPSTVIHFDHISKTAFLYSTNSYVNLERRPLYIEGGGSVAIQYLSDSKSSYFEKIALIKEWILDGEIYQVNLSQEFQLSGRLDPFKLFVQSMKLNPAPFTAFMNCGTFSIVSTSPERHICKKENRLETRPIKGTFPRASSVLQDKENREALLRSEKERAELLMITDLMRSDLGKVALPGSVHTKELFRCEAYANVFHLLSIIEAQVVQSIHPVDILRSVFPGGSVTGCPKLRAMECISQLEKRARGIYTGSLGYFAANGDFDFNIAIRTLIVHPETIKLQLGGGIVIDSDPQVEYEETLHKGHSLFSILGQQPSFNIQRS